MRYAALILGGLLAASVPTDARAQSPRTAFEDHYADVNGVRLHYASVGKGPLVLFLHGYPSFWYQWKDQMAEMGRDHLAVGLDMRGYNLSSRPEGLEPYKIKSLVEDVRQFAEKIGGKDKKFVLVAHDWGANVAWAFAMYHPEMLEKLVIINGAHPFTSEREVDAESGAAATPRKTARPGSMRGRSRARPRPASTTTVPITAIRRSTIVIRRRRLLIPW